jgi:uncharacterized protein YqgC (DUF456 family)
MLHLIFIALAAILMSGAVLLISTSSLVAVAWLFIVTLAFAIFDGVQTLSVANFAWLGGILALMILMDFILGLLGAKVFGASGRGLIGGLVGMLIGLFIFPPLGIIFGMFLGILVTELLSPRPIDDSVKAASGAVLGAVSGWIINIFLIAIYLLVFVLMAW